jgi:hypothetical protein
MSGSNGTGGGDNVTKARLFTLLIAAVMIAMLLAGHHFSAAGMADGGYW